MKYQIKKDVSMVSVALRSADLIRYISDNKDFIELPDDQEFLDFEITVHQTGEKYKVQLPIQFYAVKVVEQ